MTPADDRLDSWKEIAAYLKKGVRTVQRWEQSDGLPVRRLGQDRQGSVFAYKTELDAWWQAQSNKLVAEPEPEGDFAPAQRTSAASAVESVSSHHTFFRSPYAMAVLLGTAVAAAIWGMW